MQRSFFGDVRGATRALVFLSVIGACSKASDRQPAPAPAAPIDAARVVAKVPDASPPPPDALRPASTALLIDARYTHGESSRDSGSETQRFHLEGNVLEWSVETTGAYSNHIKEGKGTTTLSDAQIADLQKLVEKSGLLAAAPAVALTTNDGYSYTDTAITVELGGQRYMIAIAGAVSKDPRASAASSLLGALARLGHP